MRFTKRALLLVSLILAAAGGLLAESRVALVIGNGKYQYNNVLKNPANDAKDMAAELHEGQCSLYSATELREGQCLYPCRARGRSF